jgi:cell division protein FtsB
VVTLVFAILVAGFLVAFVYPTRTFMGQRDELRIANRRLEVLRDETKRLNQASRALQNDSEVARIAREQYGLVLPGETPYVPVEITPAAPTTTPP